jgi:hypothetical protein
VCVCVCVRVSARAHTHTHTHISFLSCLNVRCNVSLGRAQLRVVRVQTTMLSIRVYASDMFVSGRAYLNQNTRTRTCLSAYKPFFETMCARTQICSYGDGLVQNTSNNKVPVYTLKFSYVLPWTS